MACGLLAPTGDRTFNAVSHGVQTCNDVGVNDVSTTYATSVMFFDLDRITAALMRRVGLFTGESVDSMEGTEMMRQHPIILTPVSEAFNGLR